MAQKQRESKEAEDGISGKDWGSRKKKWRPEGGKKSKNSRGGDVNKKSKKGPRKEELEIGRGGQGAGGGGQGAGGRGQGAGHSQTGRPELPRVIVQGLTRVPSSIPLAALFAVRPLLRESDRACLLHLLVEFIYRVYVGARTLSKEEGAAGLPRLG